MQLYRIFFISIILCCQWLPALQAQESQPAQPVKDSLNEYQKLIIDLENKGVDIISMFYDEGLKEGLKGYNLNLDSLEYYFRKKYFPDGRDPASIDAGNIAILGKSYSDSIVLRWAPTSVELWKKVREDGFTLTRLAMMADSKGRVILLDTTYSSMKICADSINSIKPWTLERIGQTISPTDSMAMIAAQAMYGSSFSSEVNSDSLDFVARKEEENMRFGFSLLMADRSALAADIMGLRYVDREVEPGRKYIYMLYPIGLGPEFSTVLRMFNDPARNMKIEELKLEIGDGKIYIYWPKDKNSYSGYWIERSPDEGKTWEKLTDDPVVFIEQEDTRSRADKKRSRISIADPEDHFIYVDTVENNVRYNYRVSGQTPFADFTEYSYAEGAGTDLSPPPMPQITKYSVDENSNIATVEWTMDYDAESLADLAGFTIWDGPHPDSTFLQISGLLPASARTYRTPTPLDKSKRHYFLIKAQDDKGNSMSSFPLYMHVIDDVPPAAPVGLAYTINDSSGVVRLFWRSNEEADLGGYRVFFANSLNSEFTQLTREPILANLYFDTLALVTLTEKIYYQVQAVDKSHNRSPFSEPLEVNRPDRVAPVSPVMELPEIHEGHIRLKWRPSSSTDVQKQILYRRNFQSDQDWYVLIEFNDASRSTYNDSSALEEQIYEYTLKVLDDAGLASDYSFPVKGRRWFDGVVPPVSNLNLKFDPENATMNLNWEYTTPDLDMLEGIDYLFYIYRSKGDQPVTRYRTLDSQTTFYSDPEIDGVGTYNYGVKVVFMNGKASSMSNQRWVTPKE